MYRFINKYNIFSDSQYAFRENIPTFVILI